MTRLGTGDRRRLPIAFAVYAVWAGLTLFGMRWASDGTPRPLADTVSHGVSWPWPLGRWAGAT